MPIYRSEIPGDFEYQVAIRRLIRGPFALQDRPSLRKEALRDLSTRYRNNGKIFRFDQVIPGSEIDALFINDTQNALFVEIHALYEMLKTVQGRMRAGNSVIDSEYMKALAGFKRLRADIKQYELVKDNPGFDAAFWIDFKFEGNSYSGSLPAEIDESFGRLRLARQVAYDVTLPGYEYSPSVSIEMLTPGSMVNVADSPPGNAIDPDPKSYWAVKIYTDQPIKSYSIELPRKKLPECKLGALETYEAQGAVVSLTLNLPKAQFVNSIEIKPFGKFPVKVIDISIAASDDEPFRQIPVFDITEATQNRSPIVLDFEVLPAKKIKILVEQSNYEFLFAELATEAITHNQAFDAYLTDESHELLQPYDFLDSEELQILDDPKKRLFFMAIKELALALSKKAFSDASETDNRTSRQLNEIYAELIGAHGTDAVKTLASATRRPAISKIGKISYMLGISDLRVRYNSYAPEGEWRSKRFQNAQHISRIRLITDEDHPILYDEDNLEYRGTVAQWDIDVGQDKRIPVVPYNYRNSDDEAYIPAEILPFGKNTLSVQTRFPIDTTKAYRIRMNGKKMREVLVYRQGSISRVNIVSSVYNPDAVYTISYHPLPNAGTSVFDVSARDYLDSRPLEEPEVFMQTDSDNAVSLSTYPYIEPEIVNDLKNFHRPNPMDGKWLYTGKQGTVLALNGLDVIQVSFASTQDGSYELLSIDGKPWGRDGTVDNIVYEPIKVTVGGDKAYNVTNYINGRHPAMVTQAEGSKKYQYVHRGNLLIFNGPIRDLEIKVDYNWLVKYTRLVGKLYCGRSFSYDVTPKIRSAGLLYSRRAL